MSLPIGYRQVEYLESTGTQYIDIRRKMYNNSELELCFSFDEMQQDCSIFGSRRSSATNNFEIASTNSFPLYLDFGAYNTSRATYNNTAINTKYICTISKSLRAVYDENRTLLVRNTKLISENNVTPSNARIFDTVGGFSANKLKGKVYYCKIWEDGVLVRNMIPCKNPSNVAGMYDTVNDVFYTNAGTGTFTAGPTVVKEQLKMKVAFVKDLLPTGYIRLDYIENPDQNAYIDTGIVPDDTIGYSVRMSVKNTTADLYYLGCRESSQTDSRFGLGVYQGHTYMALGTYYSNATAWTITSDTPFVAENNYKNSRVATMNGLNPVSVGTLSGITVTRSIYLFKSNQPTTQITTNCRIYEYEITQGSSVVARFVPCLDNNGVACMYDTVRHQTFYSAGSSNFIINYVPPVVIPSGYTQLKYIGSDGSGQYVNIGYIATQTTNIECDFMITQHNSNLLNYVYGEYLANRACGLYISSSSNVYGILYGTVDRNTSIPRVFNEKVHSILSSSYFSINETTENVGYNGTYTAPYNLFLFRGNDSTRPGMIGRIYYMLIREARGVVSRYLIPCLNDQNEVGFYDVVTEQFYTNGGTGNFTYEEGIYEDLPTNNSPVEIVLFSFN